MKLIKSEAYVRSYFLIFGLVFLLNPSSYADSSCWPEEQLVGKVATSFIEGINYKEFKVDSLKSGQIAQIKNKCEVKVYESPTEKAAQLISRCREIAKLLARAEFTAFA